MDNDTSGIFTIFSQQRLTAVDLNEYSMQLEGSIMTFFSVNRTFGYPLNIPSLVTSNSPLPRWVLGQLCRNTGNTFKLDKSAKSCQVTFDLALTDQCNNPLPRKSPQLQCIYLNDPTG